MTDQIYQDFVTKLLPKIQEGLVISKEYFTDLFGRYIKYLTLMDTIGLILSVLMMIVAIYLISLLIKNGQRWFDDDSQGFLLGTIIPIIIFSALGFIGICVSIPNLIKDFYLPEIRVYESLSRQINQR